MRELEDDLFGITVEPKVGIGQQAHLVRTPVGTVLWDPIGYVDDEAAAQVRALGDVIAITSSHPHMFGVQVEWTPPRRRAVLVAEPNTEWVARPDPAIHSWPGRSSPAGGYPAAARRPLPGSASHWARRGGRGVLLSVGHDLRLPGRPARHVHAQLPQPAAALPAVVPRLADHVDGLEFDRLYGNFANDRHRRQGASAGPADRYIGWANGDHDELT